MSSSIYNDGVHSTLLNLTTSRSEILENLILYLKVSIARDKFDRSYQVDMLRTTIKMKKFYQGITGNFVGKIILESFFKDVNFTPKFPIPKVCQWKLIANLQLIIFLHQMNLTLTNVSLSDKHIPLFNGTKMLFSIRGVGKIPAKKSNVFLFNIDLFSEIKRWRECVSLLPDDSYEISSTFISIWILNHIKVAYLCNLIAMRRKKFFWFIYRSIRKTWADANIFAKTC